jgi:hypothetical protein
MTADRSLRVAAGLLVALTLGLAFAHALELPPKMTLDAAAYARVNGTLYPYFALVGGPIEVAAVLAAAALAWVRRGRAAFGLYLTAALCTAAALVTWLAVVNPANQEFGRWAAAGSIAADWERWRAQWESGHAASALLLLIALFLLLVAMTRREPYAPSLSESAAKTMTPR